MKPGDRVRVVKGCAAEGVSKLTGTLIKEDDGGWLIKMDGKIQLNFAQLDNRH